MCPNDARLYQDFFGTIATIVGFYVVAIDTDSILRNEIVNNKSPFAVLCAYFFMGYTTYKLVCCLPCEVSEISISTR